MSLPNEAGGQEWHAPFGRSKWRVRGSCRAGSRDGKAVFGKEPWIAGHQYAPGFEEMRDVKKKQLATSA